MKKPLVSIIVTTKNSSATLQKLLISIKRQSYKSFEIVIVDNNSSDNTFQIAKKFTNKIFNIGPERSRQRNYAAKQSIGQYLLVLDADMELTIKVISECVSEIQKDNFAALIIPERSFGKGFWAKVKAWERELNEGESYFEAARFFKKDIFWKYKGYDEKLTGPEDWDLPKRIAKLENIGRIKSYINHNEGKASVINFAKKKYYYGLSVHRYLKKQKSSPINYQTVYFLRPAFYRNWKKLISKPRLTIGMIWMLLIETIGGGLGYLVGRYRNE